MFKHAILSSHSLGQKIKGVDKSPSILSKYLKNDISKINSQCGDHLFKNLSNIYKTNMEIKHKPIVNIGGDHSISIATGASSLNKNKNTKFLWFDAHADINTYKESKTKNHHGMVLGYLSGACKDQKINFIKNKLNLNNLMYIGLRDIDPYEKKIIENNNIKIIRSRECNNHTDMVINKIKDFVGKDDVHVSFDVDILDPHIMKSTGTPVTFGTNISSTRIIMNIILSDLNVTNLDICELNLDIGDKNSKQRSLDAVLEIFKNSLFNDK
jgi:arginase